MKALFLAFLPLILISACTTPGSDDSTIIPFSITEETFEQKAGPDCETENANACASVNLRFPLAKGSGIDTSFVKGFNDTIQQYLIGSIMTVNPTEDASPSLDQAVETFLSDYMDFIEEVPGYEMGWTIETDYQVLLQNEKVVSIELTSYSFSGGAHPNSFVSLFIFDRTTGKLLSYPELIIEPFGLMEMAEQAFRKTRELSPEDDLTEAGFFWGEDFFLPASFGLTDTGIRFYYNPYEAAPYALGPTEFTLSYEEIGVLLNRDLVFPTSEK